MIMEVFPKNNNPEFINNVHGFDSHVEFTNIFKVKNNIRHRLQHSDLLIDTKKPPKIQQGATKTKKYETSTSTTSFFIGEGCTKHFAKQNENGKDFCIGKNIFFASKKCGKNEPFEETTSKVSLRNSVEPKESFYKLIVQSPNNEQNCSKETERAEKMTYCRPVINRYTQDFIHLAMEKNSRLQNLVKRLVEAREKEKQNDAWNNYINELRNKHGYNDPNKVTSLMQENENVIADKYMCQQFNLFENLFNDVYSASDCKEDNVRSRGYVPSFNRTPNYRNNSYCFPTASQGRLMMLNRERYDNHFSRQWQNRPIDRYFNGSTIVVDKCPKGSTSRKNIRKPNNNCKCGDYNIGQMSTQTEPLIYIDRGVDNKDDDLKTKYIKVSNNVERIREKINESRNFSRQASLLNIEEKLEILIQSVNNFIAEVKIQKATNKKSVAEFCSGLHKNNETPTNNASIREDIICGISKSNLVHSRSQNKQNDSIDDIMIEELNKSDKAKRDIEQMLTKTDHHCAVQITFDIPTKEHSTEVTKSLYEKSHDCIEDIDKSESRRITIAVNTDPLGLLALLRVSTEALKQILSYMPNIDYLSYLSRLHQPQITTSKSEVRPVSRFVCNICGASFGQPSRLSDHIKEHNLGNTRNCCVCRHVLDKKRHFAGLFPCQHCGQVFTRAYCRQLHEHACAKRAGKACHDVTTSLILLS